MMREVLGVALDSYLSIQSDCLNESVRRLTALTIAIMARL
jgi:hypothetical protein